MFRYKLRTLLIILMVAPPVLAVAVFCLVENDWQLLAGLGLIIAWLAIVFFTNVEAPKAP